MSATEERPGRDAGAPQWWSHPDRPADGGGAPAAGGAADGRPVRAPLPPAPPEPHGAPDPWAPPPTPPGDAAPARRRRAALLAGAVLLALVSGTAGGGVGALLEARGTGGRLTLPQVSDAAAERAPGSVAAVARATLPGVVYIHVKGPRAEGTGTGFVLDTRGRILTNNHVVAPAASSGTITVTFDGGQTRRATVVGRDSGYDLAVIRVAGVSGLRPLTLGDSDRVRVGDPVVAIGAPFGLEGTVTTGIVSATHRPITASGTAGGDGVSYVDALQTDAPINPGNSGGPLMDAAGRVIGVNSAIRSASGTGDPFGSDQQSGSIGLGFAIPVNEARRVAEQLVNDGKAVHPVIGVTLDMQFAGDGAKVLVRASAKGGAPVTPGGPGDRAGLRPGDVITAADGRPVHDGDQLVVVIRSHRPGDTLRLTVERGGSRRTVAVVLGAAGG
ncbi:trypsin-like peptidase domain-containing protein [Streptacidiphilus sp. ASG 303]|uniref:S1C family serine protease n=1 Tax=Streptacidiphilus sp. ASG 303 TaxID=2896847 RepID=UPI0027E0BB76|nr:trypsin-like peptidase domain-containing protein [Streptacidiphilus sp. ASG 303]